MSRNLRPASPSSAPAPSAWKPPSPRPAQAAVHGLRTRPGRRTPAALGPRPPVQPVRHERDAARPRRHPRGPARPYAAGRRRLHHRPRARRPAISNRSAEALLRTACAPRRRCCNRPPRLSQEDASRRCEARRKQPFRPARCARKTTSASRKPTSSSIAPAPTASIAGWATAASRPSAKCRGAAHRLCAGRRARRATQRTTPARTCWSSAAATRRRRRCATWPPWPSSSRKPG